MLMVGNVAVNRVRTRCFDFEDINSIRRMVFRYFLGRIVFQFAVLFNMINRL
ncbi:hypothetical protein UACE39S_01416 [Ureibacillus acetophenoni]